MNVTCTVSLGELVDKLSILIVKSKFINDGSKLLHIKKEKEVLEQTLSSLKLQNMEKFLKDLSEVNTKLWKIEDDIREKERQKKFDDEFIQLARAVYVTNDERFRIKNEINEMFGSEIREVKSYKKY